jgi:hypothetical protein
MGQDVIKIAIVLMVFVMKIPIHAVINRGIVAQGMGNVVIQIAKMDIVAQLMGNSVPIQTEMRAPVAIVIFKAAVGQEM